MIGLLLTTLGDDGGSDQVSLTVDMTVDHLLITLCTTLATQRDASRRTWRAELLTSADRPTCVHFIFWW